MISVTADLMGEAEGTGSQSQTNTQHNTNYTNTNNTTEPFTQLTKTKLNKPRKRNNKNNKQKSPPATKQTGNNLHETYSVTQINLKRKYNAWKTLLINTHGRKNPIILASEPYTNNQNLIPRINKDLVPYYYKNGDKRPRAAIVA